MKIKLSPESLEVQSFEVPTESRRDRGTVQAHQAATRPFVQCYSQHSCVYPCTDEPGGCVV